MSKEYIPDERPEDCATAWFAALERSRTTDDAQLGARAIAELRRLGVQVSWGPGMADGGAASPNHHNTPGMSLRDYFAAAALQGLLANTNLDKELGEEVTNAEEMQIAFAILAYVHADAMLKARSETIH